MEFKGIPHLTKPYRCARDDYSHGVLLDANENSMGPALPNKMVVPGKFSTGFSDDHLERYPDPRQLAIKRQLCILRNIPSEDHFFLGVGSDECIDMTFRAFCRPSMDKVLITPPTYGMYSVSAQVNDVQVVKVPLITDNGLFQLDTRNVSSNLNIDS
jgi:histidinol-phosphate aminotransferase